MLYVYMCVHVQMCVSALVSGDARGLFVHMFKCV